MTKTILLWLTLVPTIIFGQELKKITKKYKNPDFKEVYYVLKSDTSLRQGCYQKLGYTGKIQVDGFYKNGQKDSIWTEYNDYYHKKKSSGKYSLDNRIDIWEFYDFDGELEQKYDYSKNEIVYYKLNEKEKDKEFSIISGTDTIKSKLDRPPLYIGGSLSMYAIIWEYIKYPDSARENGISGTVHISFTIDSTGKTQYHRITKSIGSGCDEEALRVVKLIPDNWMPGILNGRPVNVVYILPIKFLVVE